MELNKATHSKIQLYHYGLLSYVPGLSLHRAAFVSLLGSKLGLVVKTCMSSLDRAKAVDAFITRI